MKVWLTDVTIAGDSRIELEKITNYQDLKIEIEKIIV